MHNVLDACISITRASGSGLGPGIREFFEPCEIASSLGCPSKLVSIRNNRNWNRNLFRHYPKQNVCFGCFASIPKQRVSMFRLNRNKQKTNRNSLIGSIFCNFLQKNYGFFGFFGFFRFFLGFFGFFLGFLGLFQNS